MLKKILIILALSITFALPTAAGNGPRPIHESATDPEQHQRTESNPTYNPLSDACQLNPEADICKASASNSKDLSTVVKEIITMISWIVGVLAVIMIIYAGFVMVTSSGDSGKIATAKNIILYSVVGIIVSIFAWAIVSFVVSLI